MISQRLREIAFSISDEESLSLLGVVIRVKDALAREQATQHFYVDFKSQRIAFSEKIEGIADKKDMDWYAAVTMNRLMFTYFVHEQGFLDHNLDYLQSKFAAYESQGTGAFYSDFMEKLFRFCPMMRQIDRVCLDAFIFGFCIDIAVFRAITRRDAKLRIREVLPGCTRHGECLGTGFANSGKVAFGPCRAGCRKQGR